MSFLKELMGQGREDNPYERLGYSTNPFPRQGEVRSDVFVERQELAELQADLASFLKGRPQGAVWALAGKQGFGKSNFLYHLEHEIKELEAAGAIERTAYHLVPSRSLTPSRIAEEILNAIGQDRIARLLEQRREFPPTFQNTDFGRFWQSVLRRGTLHPELGAEMHAQFLIRWLSGHQTYKNERDRYGILAREKLPPAVALPYLRGLVEMLHADRQLDHIILLLDEFEDVQLLKTAERTDYVQTLKGLLNTFNWQVLYVIIAGAPAAFEVIAESYPSLASRWRGRVAELQPVEDSHAAVALATAYKRLAMLSKDARAGEQPPNDHEVEKAFIELFNKSPGNVAQRDLLSVLHEQVERLANEESPPPKASPTPRELIRRRLMRRGS